MLTLKFLALEQGSGNRLHRWLGAPLVGPRLHIQ